MSAIEAWVPAARSAMKLVEKAIAKPSGSLALIDDAGRFLARASSQMDADVMASSGLRTIMANAGTHLDEAARLVRADATHAAGITSELRSTRFAIDLLLPYGPLF
jgi:hypothetical protein